MPVSGVLDAWVVEMAGQAPEPERAAAAAQMRRLLLPEVLEDLMRSAMRDTFTADENAGPGRAAAPSRPETRPELIERLLAGQRRQLEALRETYSDSHPLVLGLAEAITELERGLEAEAGRQ